MPFDGPFLLRYLSIWSGIGCVLFSIYVIIVFVSGEAFQARDESGALKKKMPLRGFLNMIFILLVIVVFQVVANYFGVAPLGIEVDYLSLFFLNFVHYLILFLFDTIVIDWLVLAVWQPAFLRIPDAMGKGSMRDHIFKSIPTGLAAGVFLTSISTVVSHYILFRG